MTHHSKRYVALKDMYFGKKFYDFALEARMDPTMRYVSFLNICIILMTLQSEIFKAFGKTRLLVGDKKESLYSRCGRIDKGVSAVVQVIALYLWSNLIEADMNNKTSRKLISETRTSQPVILS
ncbi:Pseudouridine synthase, putative [Theobroma cacao]|uniref:Pseudouridine synthase, putative n=1 Tax=Theobroma cacao TaxID=3641 RepID=A0A061GQN1_THECC|nr:Pseudouridine synthase, putative [Theobroma cacao]